jgi:hypothetical protein
MALFDEKPAVASSMLGKTVPQLLFPAGVGLGAVVAYYIYQAFTAQPDRSFGLLRDWGPWPLLTVVLSYFAWVLVKMVIAQMAAMSDGVKQAAVALAQLAAKDDRNAEQLQNLTEFNARQGEAVLRAIHEQGEHVEEILRRCSARVCLIEPGTK